MTTPKPKKPPRPKRKFVLIEVETTRSNKELAEAVRISVGEALVLADVLQVHVNTAKEVSRG